MKRMIPLLLIALLLLSACASGGGTAAPAAQTPETPAAAPEASQTPESPAPSPEPVSETPEIENSGGFFVRVGDEVYFRKYGPDALAKTALFARFTETYAATGEPSEIVAYDLNTGRLRTVFTDTGCGPLWYADGGFWLQETEGGELSIAWVSLDGKQERWYPEDTLLGVSDGGLAVAERYDYDGETSVHVFTLYKDLMPLAEYVTADHMTFAGVTDDALFLLRHDYDLEKYGAEP
ncbi:MAG: hypothetical protein IK136_04930, partial [Oscillospiraceae bacterium]|nr:hypothetical protein [Oscillospiraceae bacterium]